MCPPAKPPPVDIGWYWSDDDIFSLLDKYSHDSCLPNNVLAEACPYLYPPSNLPEGIWYLVNSKEKKESGSGFWRAKEEAQKIYSNSAISGWRTTLEYFEGPVPDEQRTDWLMQEYKITQNYLCDNDMPKDSKSLCRVFLSGGPKPRTEVNSKECKIIVGSQTDSVASTIPQVSITSGQDSMMRESKEKKVSEMRLLASAGEEENSSMEAFSSNLQCFLRGDYLELTDLEDPESQFSSSQNSSCPSKLSDEYFDSLSLLRDLEEDSKNLQEKNSSSRFCFPTLVRPNDVDMEPDASANKQFPGNKELDYNTKRHEPEERRGETSSSSNASSSSPDQKSEMANQEKKKKPGSSRRKKLKLYFCFRPF